MFKKLLVFGLAAAAGYYIATNEEARKQIVKAIERGKLILAKALEEGRKASLEAERGVQESIDKKS